MWRSKETVTLASFKRWFALVPDSAVKYPLLSAVLKNDENLPLVKYIGKQCDNGLLL
jgi:hypothetical protein